MPETIPDRLDREVERLKSEQMDGKSGVSDLLAGESERLRRENAAGNEAVSEDFIAGFLRATDYIRIIKAEGAREALEDLRERCGNADATLRANVKNAGTSMRSDEMIRINGKAEGVRRPGSYIGDALRGLE